MIICEHEVAGREGLAVVMTIWTSATLRPFLSSSLLPLACSATMRMLLATKVP